MPTGAIGFSTQASSSITPENVYATFTISKSVLQAGTNVIAVEVHQSNATSSDMSFDLEASTTIYGTANEYTSSTAEISDVAETSVTMVAVFEAVEPITGIVINEIGATGEGAIDNFGEKEDWIELYNTNATSVDVGGLFITDDLTQKTKYQIPVGSDQTIVPAQGYKVLFADGQKAQGSLHLDFKLSATGEAVGLYQAVGDALVTIDEVTFPVQEEATSYARIPNGTGPFIVTETMTPGAENQETIVSVPENNSFILSVYPNPSSGEVHFLAEEHVYRVSLHSIQGLRLIEIPVNGVSGSIDVTALPAGVYLLRLEAKSGAKTLKLLKK
jgi:hypothetical protein